MSLKVFISHSGEDIELVKIFMALLKIYKMEPCVPLLKLEPGSERTTWGKVEEEIRNSDYLLLIGTKAALRSAWVNQEIGYAKGIWRPIFRLIEKKAKRKGILEGRDYYPFDKLDPLPGIAQAIYFLKEKYEEKGGNNGRSI